MAISVDEFITSAVVEGIAAAPSAFLSDLESALEADVSGTEVEESVSAEDQLQAMIVEAEADAAADEAGAADEVVKKDEETASE